ncbi:Gpi-anchored wall transfer protein 1, partial [Globisporangium splendens]
MINDDAYKRAKEAFVADLHGTSAREVFAVFAIMPGSQWLYSEVMLLLEVAGLRPVGSGYFSLLTTILVEFVMLGMPTMVAFTYAELALPLLASVYLLALVLNLLSWKHAREYVSKHCRKEKMNQLLSSELPFLTCFRAQIMHSTVFAILAVDFTVFPRRFAKTETFGFSVMDIGVGAFIVSSAIVSSYARQSRPAAADKKRHVSQHSFGQKLYAFVRPIALILILGSARFLTVKGVNYQEHVTEYGVHWNFYFTLGGVYLAYSFLQVFGKWTTNPVVALSIIIGYQLYLTHDGGEDFILYAPRDTLFEQNREGILSLAGYTSLYMFAVSTGQVTFGYMESNGAKAVRNMRWLALSFTVLTIVLVVATFVSVRLIARPSRRMVRSTHCPLACV